MKNSLIVGAGLTGLWIARKLKMQNQSATIVEKSKGVGGRMATRRWNDQKFDHGAQFYKLKTESEEFHQIISPQSGRKMLLENQWFSTQGISSLAKILAEGLTLQLEKKVCKISKEDPETYAVHIENSEVLYCQQLILTCPLPQTLQILDESKIVYHDDLRRVTYAKALVFLLSSPEKIPFPFSSPYHEPSDSAIFSVTDQNWKTGLRGSAWTITMNPDWSEQHFTKSTDEQLAAFKSEFKFLHPSFQTQVKTWRYSHPNQTVDQKSALIQGHSHLYLAGDAFGGPSLNGALRSAEKVLRLLD